MMEASVLEEEQATREVVKTCTACGRGYTAVEWMKLPPACGGALWDLVEDGGGLFVLRNCSCGGTMAITLIEPRDP